MDDTLSKGKIADKPLCTCTYFKTCGKNTSSGASKKKNRTI